MEGSKRYEFLQWIARSYPTAKSVADYGALSAVPAPVLSTLCAGSSSVAVDPSERFVYVSGGVGVPGHLCGFSRNPDDTFSPIGGAPITTGTNPGAIAIEPSGRFLYVPGGGPNGAVSGYEIDPVTGIPSPLPGLPFPTNGEFPQSAVVDSAGRFLYVGQAVGSFSGSIAVFAIDGATGALSHVAGSPFPTLADGGTISALALSADGRFLFTGGTLTTYAVNPTTGTLTRLAFQYGYFFGLTVDPTGRFLFAPDFFNNVVHGFSIAANGALTPVGAPQPIGKQSRSIVSISDLVYVGSGETGQAYGFRRSPMSGALAPVPGSPFPAGELLAATGYLGPSVAIEVGDSLITRLGAHGGRPPYTWSIVSGALPPGIALNEATGVVSGIASGAGAFAFTVMVTDGLGATASSDKTIAVAGAQPPVPVTLVEFHNASLDHYFITHAADEIAKLDNGTLKGWARTGLSFKGFATSASGTSAICRIYIPPGKGDGHFFGRDTTECDGTIARNPTFILESSTFFYEYSPSLGTCGAGQVPVYRVFSNRADANHRYTIDRAVRDQMVTKGWLAEGDGPDVVVTCAPA